jgi:prepilin-type N-terminal cleavage/methylation domain-containing protein
MSVFRERTRGFTFVELLVACAVLGILATIVYGSVASMRGKARDTERKTEIEQLRLAFRLIKDQTGSYPAGYDSGAIIGESTTGINAILSPYTAGTISDPNGSASDTTYEYVYVTNFNCPTVGTNVTILYAKSMERSENSNWTSVCNGTDPGTNTYAVILR